MRILKPVETSSPIHAAVPIIPYCAGCNRSWPADPQRRLGRRFICPRNPKHVAAIVKGEPGKFWLRIEARILRYELFSLGFIAGPLARYKALLMILLRLLLAAAALVISGYGLAWRIASCALAILVVFDVLINATAVAFISRFPTHVLRSIFMLFISLALTVAAFGALYSSTRFAFNTGSRLARFDAVYFSFVTMTTVGYGDIFPTSHLSRVIVMCELITGLYFFSTLLVTFATWIGSPPSIEEPATYDALFPESE
jgi:Ion channel